MTFSHSIKNELIENLPTSYRQAISELIGIIIGVCRFDKNKFGVTITLDNEMLFDYIKKLIYKYLPLTIYRDYIYDNLKSKSYIIELYNYTIYFLLRELYGNGDEEDVNTLFDYSIIVKNALIRGMYIVCGSLSNPRHRYHLEFCVYRFNISSLLNNILNFFLLNSKVIRRKERFIIYIKEGESISEFLRIIGTNRSLLEFEGIRVLKEYSNNKNRITNCIEANEDKLIITSVRQVRAIMIIIDKIGIDSLPPKLREVAELRLKYKEMSLKELGEYVNPPISKSGVLHRFRKIEDIARKLES